MPPENDKAKEHKRDRISLIISAIIPVSIFTIAWIRQILEYYFRYSRDYKWVYTIGSTTGLFLQLLILFFSVLFSIHLLLVGKEFRNKWIGLAALLLTLLPFSVLVIFILFRQG
jgi:hypothetical protein